jgi:diguanylate cyclase (GGDEF)-like protein/putative nucleotidyltransferase with HDIG domain
MAGLAMIAGIPRKTCGDSPSIASVHIDRPSGFYTFATKRPIRTTELLIGPMPLLARLYIAAVVTSGLICCAVAIYDWSCPEPTRYISYIAVAAFASALKVTLPGITGTMSVNYVFILLAIIELSYTQTLLLACIAISIQTGWRANNTKFVHGLFNWSSMANAATGGYLVYRMGAGFGVSPPLSIAAAASAFFLINTISVAGVVSLSEGKNVFRTWHTCYFWSFPYYLVGAAAAALVSECNKRVGWQMFVLVLPVVYFFYRSYSLYLGKLASEKRHAEEMAALHLRTIEALALAIEAKDDNTHDHIQRVQVYAVELGKILGLDESHVQALRAASILHDIGKLAVPEHIISKPGKLTPEEFEKMKIHPVVGAEILSRVEFPYPVVPIVRAHHEKWDGTGYPDGIKGEAIPIGARILAAVDCLDALASDRQYRRALPLDEAMGVVAAEGGRSYDPTVIRALEGNYRRLEKMARTVTNEHAQLSKHIKVENGSAPDAGLEARGLDAVQPEFLSSIAAARHEAQMLYELTKDLGNSLNLHETLSVLDSRLKRLIPYDSIAMYLQKDGCLTPAYVNGESFRLFASLRIPVGQGLSGWVAENRKPIINGNPSVEPGYLNDPSKFSNLRSALAVPLENGLATPGVLALYHASRDAFSKDHLRVLLAINPKISLAVENALKYEQAAISATTDALTNLPNARSLFLHLDAELSRCRRSGASLLVLVSDLDGFKQVNDRFGHLEGNKVLKLVADALRRSCREYDYVARMGGDEFVLLLADFRPEDLPEKLEQIETIVAQAGTTVCGEALMAISTGAAFYPDDGEDAESLLAIADRRMYITKQGHKGPALPSSTAALAALDAALR